MCSAANTPIHASSTGMCRMANHMKVAAIVSAAMLFAPGVATAACHWSVSPSTNMGPGNNDLNGVAAIADNDAWAVGYASNGVANRTLIEHWDGSNWTIVPSPNANNSDNFLLKLA